MEFDNEYSSFPDASTLVAVKESTESPLTAVTGTASNDYFRQILAAGIGNEKMFYAKTADSKKQTISTTPRRKPLMPVSADSAT